MKSSDYNSRNPTPCDAKRCQICLFANEMESIGDNVPPMVGKVTVEDNELGRVNMPYTQRNAWFKVQKNDTIHKSCPFLLILLNFQTRRKPEDSTHTSKGYTTSTEMVS